MMDKERFAGISFCISNPTTAAQFTVDMVRLPLAGADFHFLNAYSIALADSDAAYLECLTNATFNFPDGKPISILSRLRSGRLIQVRGPGFFEGVMDIGRKSGVRHYLLGSTQETLEKLQLNLEYRYPGLQIVGATSPPFRQMTACEQGEQDDRIRESGAQLVWVGLGTPKQDYEAARLAACGFNAIAIGAAFDFSAGTKAEAPTWISIIGFEWLFRFASEPRRLWRRYLLGNLVFLRAALRADGVWQTRVCALVQAAGQQSQRRVSGWFSNGRNQ